jgi:HNH endonuclease
MITQDIVKEKLIYDPETGIFIRKTTGRQIGFKNRDGYVAFVFEKKQWVAHRLAWIYVHGHIPEGLLIDHINGIRDDNRISNLRLATHKLNVFNRGVNRIPSKLQQHLKNKTTLLTGILTLS